MMEGLIEVAIGLFLSRSIANIMAAFPMAIVGGMMLLVAVQLGEQVVRLRGWALGSRLVTAALCAITAHWR